MKQKIREAIAVEGRYDAHMVRSAVDATVIELGGFSILKNNAKRKMLATLAATQGLIVLTDSDSAGFLIRAKLKDALKTGTVKMAYVPAVAGKERRKEKAGKEGLLGVEGMPPEVILQALINAGATFADKPEASDVPPKPAITRGDLYEMGFFGRADSASRRAELLAALDLPPHVSVSALVDLLQNPAYAEKYYRYTEEEHA